MDTVKKVWDSLVLRFVCPPGLPPVMVVVAIMVALLSSYSLVHFCIDVKETTYTVKIADDKGSIVTLYQKRKVELKDGFVYVCDPKVYSCLGDKSSVIIGGNVILEPEN